MALEGDVDAPPLMRNHLKERLASGQLAVCLRTTLVATDEIAFICHATGFDALYVDLEHSTASVADAARVCATATALGTTSLVRLDSVEDAAAVRLLEAGCQGLIAPHVETAEQAERLVDRCLYPPLGHRSASAPGLRLGYAPLPPTQLWSQMNAATLLCVLVESEQGIANVGQIAAVPGVDLVLVGTQDLTYSLGVPGVVDHPAVLAAYERVAEAAAATGKAFGVAGVSDADTLARYIDLGARFVSAGSDIELLRAGAAARVGLVRGLAAPG